MQIERTPKRQALDILNFAHKALISSTYDTGFWERREHAQRVVNASTALVHAMAYVMRER